MGKASIVHQRCSILLWPSPFPVWPFYADVLVDEADLIHQEHGTIRLPRGIYEVRIQREYTPKGIRKVVD